VSEIEVQRQRTDLAQAFGTTEHITRELSGPTQWASLAETLDSDRRTAKEYAGCSPSRSLWWSFTGSTPGAAVCTTCHAPAQSDAYPDMTALVENASSRPSSAAGSGRLWRNLPRSRRFSIGSPSAAGKPMSWLDHNSGRPWRWSARQRWPEMSPRWRDRFCEALWRARRWISATGCSHGSSWRRRCGCWRERPRWRKWGGGWSCV